MHSPSHIALRGQPQPLVIDGSSRRDQTRRTQRPRPGVSRMANSRLLIIVSAVEHSGEVCHVSMTAGSVFLAQLGGLLVAPKSVHPCAPWFDVSGDSETRSDGCFSHHSHRKQAITRLRRDGKYRQAFGPQRRQPRARSLGRRDQRRYGAHVRSGLFSNILNRSPSWRQNLPRTVANRTPAWLRLMMSGRKPRLRLPCSCHALRARRSKLSLSCLRSPSELSRSRSPIRCGGK